MRPIWKGAISFGLVTIPVGLYSATESKRPSFRDSAIPITRSSGTRKSPKPTVRSPEREHCEGL